MFQVNAVQYVANNQTEEFFSVTDQPFHVMNKHKILWYTFHIVSNELQKCGSG